MAVSHRDHQKNLAYFSHLAPIVLFLFTKRQSQKGGDDTMAPLLNTLLRAGFRQLEALSYLIIPIGRAKKGLHLLICPVFTENIDIIKSKKKIYGRGSVGPIGQILLILFFVQLVRQSKMFIFLV